MKRFAIVCAFVLLLNVLCPVGHMHAEEISTPTDVECTHPQYEMTDYTSDNTHHWRECPDCGEKLDMLEHNDKCYPEGAGVCNDCGRTDVTFGFTGHGYIDMDTYSSDTYMHWNVCEACGEKINANYHVGTAGGDCTVCGAPYACAHAYGQYEFDDTHHWFVCEGCGENVNKEEHDAKPGDVGDNCTVCGAYVVCNHTNKSEWHYDALTHWKECVDCGFVVDELGHDNWANCSVCGYVCEHLNKSSWMNDELTHWQECLDCGSALPGEAHYSEGNPGTCAVCWANFTDCKNGLHKADYTLIVDKDENVHWYGCEFCGEPCANQSHGSDWCWDETHHWIGCSTCNYRDENQFIELHTANCNAPTECLFCSFTNVAEDRMFHNADYSKYVYDEKEHWYACYCGEERSSVFTHEAFCDDPNTCGTCEAVLPEPMEVDHVARYEGADGFDETSHWWYCTLCGEIALKENHWAWCDWPNYCDRDDCTNTTEIRHCGAMSDDDHDPETHALTCYCGDIYYDFTNFVTVRQATCSEDGLRTKRCSFCNELIEEVLPATGHAWGDPVTVEATCTTDGSITTTCTACGEKTVETIAAGHQIGYTYDDTMHYLGCKNCDYQIDSFWHYDHCDNQGVCFECGATDVTFDFTGHELLEENVRYNQDEHWWVCSRCEQEVNHIEHMALCTEPDVCYECGATGVNLLGMMHENWTMEGNAEKHWESCSDCGLYEEGKHVDLCTNPDGKCEMCGEACGEEALNHLWKETSKTEVTCLTDGVKKYTCEWCKKTKEETTKAIGKHTWGETVTVEATCVAAGSKTTACTVCGEKTVETIPATGKHTWETVSQTYANCTKAGRTERICTVCDELSITTQGAKGHAYGLVFITEGNGTHAKTCETCGAKHVEDCVLTSMEMGNMVCSACATCGYAVYTMADSVLEEVEGLTETKAEIEVKRVENVSFEIVAEPAEEGTETEAEAESTETADVVLVVHETELEMTVELPDTVNASVKKVLAVSMLKEGNAIQPSSKVKLSIPVVEEEVAGMKLVLMGENGQLIEIEYEIIDGVIVFETDMVGIFLFVEAEA